jgi:hypothetical protein
MKTRILFLIIMLFSLSTLKAQIGINSTNTAPAASAMLDVSSTNKGLLIPRMTTAQRTAIASPANGLTVYDTNTLGFWFYNGSSWQSLLTVNNNLWLANGANIFNNNSGNIGIGTNMPDAKLHIKSATANALYKAETNNAMYYAGLELKSDGGIYDALEVKKWAPIASGSLAGIPLDGLSTITTGASTSAGLLVGTIPAQPMYFSTHNKVRMRIKADGTVAIGHSPFSFPTKMHIETSNADSIALVVENNGTSSSSLNYAINAVAHSETGIGVQGATVRGGFLAGVETTSYGLLGISSSFSDGNIPVSVGAFALEGTALRARSESGFALKTSGLLRFDGIGEGLNKVLTSDAIGNATWQDASASSGWSKNMSGDIYNNPNNGVIIGSNTLFQESPLYGNPIGFQVTNRHSLFYDQNGGNPVVRILGPSTNPQSVPSHAGVALYVENNGSPAAIFKSAYSGLEVVSSGPNLPHSAGIITLNNPTSLANALDVSNNGLGYALTVNNIGAGSNASGYFSNSNTTYTPNSNIDLELNNGYLKVSGNARTMFSVTTTAPTINANGVVLNYPGMSINDMLVVTHNWNGNYIGGVGVYWSINAWTIFRQDQQAMPVGEKFNVLVVKQ